MFISLSCLRVNKWKHKPTLVRLTLGSSNNENENPVTGQGKRQPRLQPSGYSSTWLNCSSNYQTLFDLSSSSVAACRPDQTLFEGHRGQNLEDRQEADYCIPENSDQKLADNDTYLVNNSTKVRRFKTLILFQF